MQIRGLERGHGTKFCLKQEVPETNTAIGVSDLVSLVECSLYVVWYAVSSSVVTEPSSHAFVLVRTNPNVDLRPNIRATGFFEYMEIDCPIFVESGGAGW